jgi:hypothetical protein
MNPELGEFLSACCSSKNLIFSTHISAAHELQRDVRAEFTDITFLAGLSKKRSLSAFMLGSRMAAGQIITLITAYLRHVGWGVWGVGINGIDGRNMTDYHGYISLWQLHRFHLSH